MESIFKIIFIPKNIWIMFKDLDRLWIMKPSDYYFIIQLSKRFFYS